MLPGHLLLCACCRQPYWPAVWEGRRRGYEARHRPAAGTEQQQQQQQQGSELAPAAQAAGRPLPQPDEQTKGAAAWGQTAGAQPEATGLVAPRQQPRRGQLVPLTYGLFGVGRRQHLAAFVGVRGRKRRGAAR